jgi:hypothetical protein
MKGGLMFGMKPRNKRHPMPSERKQKQKAGWGARIRTWEWRNQNPNISPANINEHFEKIAEYDLNSMNRSSTISEWLGDSAGSFSTSMPDLMAEKLHGLPACIV